MENLSEVMDALVPFLAAFCGWAAGQLRKSRKETAAIKSGLKGLLRAKVIDLGLHYVENREIPPYGLETMRSCYDPYMALGDGDPAVSHIMKKCESLPVRSGRD